MTEADGGAGGGGKAPLLLGWREWAALPEWGVRHIRAKLDTGARTSAIHVTDLQDAGGDRVRFDVVVREQPRRVVTVEAAVVRTTTIKNSRGEAQPRPVVRTRLRIGPLEREVELSLVCRAGMLCRMLVGRLALAGGAIVDPSAKYRITSRRRP